MFFKLFIKSFLNSKIPFPIVKERKFSDRYLSDRYLSDRYLFDRYLSERYLSERFLSDRYLSDHYLSDRYLSYPKNVKLASNILDGFLEFS